MLWNLKNRNGFNLLSRSAYTIAAMTASLPCWGESRFWKALTSTYQSGTFASGEAQQQASIVNAQPLLESER